MSSLFFYKIKDFTFWDILFLSGKYIFELFLSKCHFANISYILSNSIVIKPSSFINEKGSKCNENVLELTIISNPFADNLGNDNFSIFVIY